MGMSKRAIALEASLVEAFKGHGDPNRLLQDFDGAMLEHALFMRTRARSHRDPKLLVGSCGIGFLPSGRPALLEGANNSPVRGVPRDCAEMDILGFSTYRECDRLGKMVVASNGDEEIFAEVNGLPTPTLDPCSDCRALFSAHPVITPHLAITGFNCDTGARIEQTFGDVLDRYDNIEPPLTSRLLLGSSALNSASI